MICKQSWKYMVNDGDAERFRQDVFDFYCTMCRFGG